ncbi:MULTISPECIES: ABC transporter ATP-binding protein [Ralstonia solanacearum species complex]|uniref:Autoinducer 2 ABC transporter ATP-binding protein LsrA n=2 Tax=Ralstonia solanacearum species complex TaxID=3116862 RepID=A0A0S4U6X7_RALSL|nr:ABC transporter ATP-binding protein [Ralstonia pseudosolanacearum]AUS41877.1 copper ABC transporter ATP-binding protein [Ralstonia solanacearum]AVV67618.1 ABC transporter ATP-binding protein [Ralstonia solanacearum OE1-1]API77805.1 copper ABC transporter ATP-binding protein [Ralstonia pseudosolanacearum]AST89194.1 ABC transporter ATP-binding protein [Ralstonia pseudosolanacearum]AXV75252.1 ABC transporter ATP-binding protein [Ralstonia solanacearum]
MTSSLENNAAIVLRDVGKDYGTVRAVDGVNLEVGYGELFGLIGHNGAGKSTLFRMMLGLIPVSEGEIHVAGASLRTAAFRAARRRIGYLPENLALYDNLSGLETLRFFARLKGAPTGDCEALLARVGLQGATAKPVRAYSKGMRQRLGFAQALLGAPRVLFLDEPTNGLDPAAIHDFYAMLQRLREQGVTILITSHILAELQQRIDRLAVMADGRILALGSVAGLREQADLPLALVLRVESGSRAAFRQHLAPLRAHGVEIEDGPAEQDLTLRCRHAVKMQVLATLQSLGGRLLDLQIREASLEDLFFGLGSAA